MKGIHYDSCMTFCLLLEECGYIGKNRLMLVKWNLYQLSALRTGKMLTRSYVLYDNRLVKRNLFKQIVVVNESESKVYEDRMKLPSEFNILQKRLEISHGQFMLQTLCP